MLRLLIRLDSIFNLLPQRVNPPKDLEENWGNIAKGNFNGTLRAASAGNKMLHSMSIKEQFKESSTLSFGFSRHVEFYSDVSHVHQHYRMKRMRQMIQI